MEIKRAIAGFVLPFIVVLLFVWTTVSEAKVPFENQSLFMQACAERSSLEAIESAMRGLANPGNCYRPMACHGPFKVEHLLNNVFQLITKYLNDLLFCKSPGFIESACHCLCGFSAYMLRGALAPIRESSALFYAFCFSQILVLLEILKKRRFQLGKHGLVVALAIVLSFPTLVIGMDNILETMLDSALNSDLSGNALSSNYLCGLRSVINEIFVLAGTQVIEDYHHPGLYLAESFAALCFAGGWWWLIGTILFDVIQISMFLVFGTVAVFLQAILAPLVMCFYPNPSLDKAAAFMLIFVEVKAHVLDFCFPSAGSDPTV